jgi:hypothetical protein
VILAAEDLLRDEDAAWTDLRRAIDAVPQERFETPDLTPDGWSVKVAVYHVASWIDDAGEQLEAMRAGTFEGRIDTVPWIEEQNRRQFERSLPMPPAEVRAFAERARSRMRAGLEALPELTPDAIEWFEESGALHYRTHLQDLRGWIDHLHEEARDRP